MGEDAPLTARERQVAKALGGCECGQRTASGIDLPCPEHGLCVTLTWDGGVPPSFNVAGFTGSRWKLTKAVNEWKENIGVLLMCDDVLPPMQVPAPLEFITADVLLTFDSNRKRDPENYRVVIFKALGDVVAPHDAGAPRLIPDDDSRYFRARDLELQVERGAPPRTEIILRYR